MELMTLTLRLGVRTPGRRGGQLPVRRRSGDAVGRGRDRNTGTTGGLCPVRPALLSTAAVRLCPTATITIPFLGPRFSLFTPNGTNAHFLHL